MITRTSWEQRQEFISFPKNTEKENLANFETLKESYSYYDFVNTDEELETVLYNNLCHEIEKITTNFDESYTYQNFLTDLIIRDYADEYLKKVHPEVMNLIEQNNNAEILSMNLFEYRKQISEINKQIINEILEKYMIKIQTPTDKNSRFALTEGVTGQYWNINSDSFIALIISRINNLFDFTKEINASRVGPKFIYNQKFWQNYADSLKTVKEEIETDFSKTFKRSVPEYEYAKYDEFDQIAFFKQSMDNYRQFASLYNYKLNTEKTQKKV